MRPGLPLALALLSIACSSEDGNDCPGGPTFAAETGGRTRLYRGCDVWRELRDDGTFTPDSDDDYTLLDIPTDLLPKSPTDPTTVTLCDPAWDLRVEFHDTYCAIDRDPNNPILTSPSEDECVIHGASGEPGIHGGVQVRLLTDGTYEFAVGFRALVDYTDQDGNPTSLDYGRGGWPSDLADPTLEDPLLSDPCGCRLADPESCEPDPDGP